jgi:hypothetical protein
MANSPEYSDNEIQVQEKVDNFLTGWATTSFSRRTLLHEINISSNLMEVYNINAYLSPSPQEKQPISTRGLKQDN